MGSVTNKAQINCAWELDFMVTCIINKVEQCIDVRELWIRSKLGILKKNIFFYSEEETWRERDLGSLKGI